MIRTAYKHSYCYCTLVGRETKYFTRGPSEEAEINGPGEGARISRNILSGGGIVLAESNFFRDILIK